MYCLDAVNLVEPVDNCVGIVGINLDAIGTPSGLFSCDQRRTTAGEGIENDPPALGAVQNRIGNQRQRLDRWVHGKFGIAVLAKGVPARVIPHICAITTKAP